MTDIIAVATESIKAGDIVVFHIDPVTGDTRVSRYRYEAPETKEADE